MVFVGQVGNSNVLHSQGTGVAALSRAGGRGKQSTATPRAPSWVRLGAPLGTSQGSWGTCLWAVSPSASLPGAQESLRPCPQPQRPSTTWEPPTKHRSWNLRGDGLGDYGMGPEGGLWGIWSQGTWVLVPALLTMSRRSKAAHAGLSKFCFLTEVIRQGEQWRSRVRETPPNPPPPYPQQQQRGRRRGRALGTQAPRRHLPVRPWVLGDSVTTTETPPLRGSPSRAGRQRFPVKS